MKRIQIFIYLSLLLACDSKKPDIIIESKNDGEVQKDEKNIEGAPDKASEMDLPLVIQEKKSNSQLPKISFERLEFTIDTLVIDSGEELVNLPFGLSRSSLSKDKSRLYALHPSLGTLYIFDLKGKRLQELVKFEKDGPNSIPPLVWYFQLLEGGKFLMSDYGRIGIYDSKGAKLETISLSPKEFSQLTLGQEITLFHQLQYHSFYQKIFTLPTDSEGEKISIAIYEKISGKTQVVPLPNFESLTRFDLVYKEGINSAVANMAEMTLVLEKNRILVYSEGCGNIYTYDIASGELAFTSPDHKLVPKQKDLPPTRSFTTLKQFEFAYHNLLPQIAFGDLIYDDSRQIYFRFGSILKPGHNYDPTFSKKVFLFGYDKDFNLLGETEIKKLNQVPQFPFFKDGKLWSYVNVNDELGFAVMEFKF
ncbi:DUF4221 family protein [Algoriphagus taiwanensis]|uniref:6-bladed beta-propeller protein n=1 Tax=Algoriphagus taiwanensis TaxID=1445656 RepID=A0ABQ6Q137_9BACT|nr:hypothetical protein Ataiwa_21330 [Algoriphagus taiwanensis]